MANRMIAEMPSRNSSTTNGGIVRMSASLATYIPPQIAEESASAKDPCVLAFTAGQSSVYGLAIGARSAGLSQSEWPTLVAQDDGDCDT